MKAWIRFAVARLVGLFYAKLEVQYPERLRRSGPVIYVLNHPNGLLDPAVLTTVLDRPVTFWCKSTLFAYSIVGWLARSFGAVPVFRRADIGLRGGAADEEDMARKNEQTMADCRSLLHGAHALALFPEGLTHAQPYLFPLRTGAARLALQAEAEAGWECGLTIVPVGLWYENSTRFRSAVLVSAGEPITLHEHAEEYSSAPAEAVRALTDRIAERLRAVVLQAENVQLMRTLPAVAAWTVPEGAEPDMAAQHAWTSRLLTAYRMLQERDPARLERLTEQSWRFFVLLKGAGITNPWGLEAPPVRWHAGGLTVLKLLLFAVPALLGYLVSFIPYRASGTVVRTMLPYDRTQVGTAKLLGGTLFSIATWVLLAVMAGLLVAPRWGLLLAILAPTCAYAAMRWAEWRDAAREVWAVGRLRKRRAYLANILVRRRSALAQSVRKAVASVE